MSETNLPIEFNPSQLPVFQGDIEDGRPILYVDQGTGENSIPGTFNYSGSSLKEMEVVFVTGRETRRLYAAEYNVDPKAPLVCASWDGVNAFGSQRQSYNGELADRECKGCPLAKAFICKPSFAFLVLIRGVLHDGSRIEKWSPAIFTVRGICATPTKKAFRSLKNRANAQVIRDKNGNEAPAPLYLFSQSAKLYKPDRSRQGYTIEWGASTVLPAEDMREVVAWVVEHGKELWDEDLAATEAQCRAIGMTDDSQESSSSGPRKDDPIPF